MAALLIMKNLYAASLFAELRTCVADLEQQIAVGNFAPILKFLRDRIHKFGHLYETPELLHKAVGRRDHVQDCCAASKNGTSMFKPNGPSVRALCILI